ncbi:MAG: RHS repeat domain-containing protein [Candidatus Margulisiibacteriota bacterium]
MEWDLDKRIPKKTILKRNGQIQEETLINDYDDYNNPLSITHKKSGLTDLQTTLTYYYPEPGVGDSSIVDWNFNRRYILGRIKSKETVSPEGRTNAFFYTYWNNKIASICEGRDSSGKLLKEMRYFYNGRIQTQTLYGPNGPLTTQFNYMDAPSKQTITQTTNGKTSTIELEGFTGKPIKITGINGGITTYAYDAYGRVISATGPDNIPITYSYSSDLKTTTVTGGGRTVASTVDSMGRTILVDNPSGEEDIKTDYYYGDLPLAVYTGTNTWTLKKSYTYDDLLRKKTVTSPDFGTTTTSYDDGSNTVTVTDTKGRQTVSYQNELNQTTKTVFVPDNSQTLSTYDNFGRVATTTDPRGLIHKADQDAYGRITKTYFPGTGTLQRTIPTYSQQAPNVVESIAIYDKTGVLSKTYAYAYDVEGRVTQTKLNGTVQETLTYDQGSNGKGHLVQAETPDALSTYTYDSAGRPIQTQTTIKALSKTVQSTYTYNPTNGQVANLTFNDGKALSYTYDSNQKLQSQRYNGLALATYSYNPNGTIAQITLGNGTTLTYTYDKQILLKSITAKTASGTTLYTQTYAYDAQGIPTATQHNDYLFSTGSTINRAWTYDAKNQLTQVQLNQQPQYTYQWDKNGNPTRFESPNNKNLGQPNITVASDQDQIVRKNQADGRYTLYAYDAEGNQISRTRYNPTNQPQTQRTYTYNYQGQLVQAKDDGTTIGTYGYDENRQRIYKKTDATTKWIQWDLAGNQIGEGLATSNTYEVKYLYSGNQKLAMIRTENGQEKTYYFINNAQGTPVIMIDTNNMVVSKINLDEFGNLGPSIKLNANSHEINYTGKKRDPETGLYYFNQRHYDPEIGRFLTEDPAGQCLNPYLYAANSPLVYVDPDGEFFQFLIPLFVSALQAGATSAAINAGMQLALTGKIDGQGVLNAFGSGALSGALSFGVGEMMGHATEGLGKTLAHGVSGGLQSMTSGGSFGSGFVGGAIGNLAAEASNGAGMLEQAGIAGIAGGVTSMAAGGSFANGFQSGAYNVLYNKFGEGLKERLTGFTGKLSHGLSNLDVRLGGSIDVWQFSLNYDRGSGFQKSAQVIPSIGASFYADMVSKGIDERSTVTAGFKYLGLRVINGKSTKFGLGLSAGVGIGLPINYSVPVR